MYENVLGCDLGSQVWAWARRATRVFDSTLLVALDLRLLVSLGISAWHHRAPNIDGLSRCHLIWWFYNVSEALQTTSKVVLLQAYGLKARVAPRGERFWSVLFFCIVTNRTGIKTNYKYLLQSEKQCYAGKK
jgi:hypothetical protein